MAVAKSHDDDFAKTKFLIWLAFSIALLQFGNGNGEYEVRFFVFREARVTEYSVVGAVGTANQLTTSHQTEPKIVALGGGRVLVLWSTGDASQDGSFTAIKARIFDAAGQPLGDEFLVNTNGVGDQQNATVTVLSDGRFVVAWSTTDATQDGSFGSIRAQIFDALGHKQGSEFTVNTLTTGDQWRPSVTALANGSFVIGWESSQPVSGGTFGDVKAQIYDASGAQVGTEFLVNTNVVDAQGWSNFATLANGNFVATWQTGSGSSIDIRAQIFTAAGAKVGGEFGIATALTGIQFEQKVIGLSDGRFVAVWTTLDAAQDGSGSAIKGQIFGANGAKIGAEFLVNANASGSQGDPSIAALADGTFIVTFARETTISVANTSTSAIVSQIFDANGNRLGEEFVVSNDASDVEFNPAVVALANGGFAIAFEDLRNFGTASNSEIGLAIYNVTSSPISPDVTYSVQENQTNIATIVPGSVTGGTISYSISGGLDAARFSIDANTGALSFVGAPNFELPTDATGNNVYDVIVQASNGTQTETQVVAVAVTNVNEAPVITSNGGGASASVTIQENATTVTSVTSMDPDHSLRNYSIVGGADAARFTINATTGALAFVSSPNFEAPTDSNVDNIYNVIVQVSDGNLVDTQTLAVTVTNTNEAPVITSNGGGASASISFAENGTNVTTVVANDPEGTPRTYSIIGGADAARFAIDATTGVLRFIAAPNFEAPNDVGTNNVYDVIVQASDGMLVDTQTLAVTVANVNEAPVITSSGGGDSAAISIAENSTGVVTVTSTDPENTARYYVISGGADAARFTINNTTGALSFISAPNFEAPTDANGDNIYNVIVQVNEGTPGGPPGGLIDTQALAITVTNVNDAPVITSDGGGVGASIFVSENSSIATTVVAADPEGAALTYSISGGTDAARFSINATTGVLSFVSSPNFESPNDSNVDNRYSVTVRVTDGVFADTQNLTVTVTNVNEAPVITSNGAGTSATISIAENSLAVTTVTSTDPENTARIYSISGGADAALFAINATTGALSFVNAPNFEAPTDAGANNVYDVIVSASDGSLADMQTLAISVGNLSEAPVITSNGGGAAASLTVDENDIVVTMVAATDPEGNQQIYSIIGGADAAFFVIDGVTGALSFVTAPNHEAPADADGDNVYDVIVQASDGTLVDTQAIAVTVANVNEAPVITSNGGGVSAAIGVSENGDAVAIVTAADVDGQSITFAISGGADAASFAIDAATGVLSFINAPDFAAPTDAGADNVYDVIVSASDGSLVDTQSLAITVDNVNEAPVITSNSGGASASLTVMENDMAVTTVAATDPDNNPRSYSIIGGADAALFAIDAATGALAFVNAPDHETPADADGDNVYEVVVQASDGSLSDSQNVSVTVGNINEAPVISSDGGGASAVVAVGEYSAAVTTVTADDIDGSAVSFAISGGADAALFAIDPLTGVLSFIAAPDFEAPGDADLDNVYDVIVTASDGMLIDTQSLAISVSDMNETPDIISDGGGAAASVEVGENGVAVTIVTASDPDGNPRSYAIAGGADAALFAIDPVTGALSFVTAPDFEAPIDADGNNVCEVVVIATDGSLSDSQAISVTVGNVNEAPVITSNGGGATTAIGASENNSAVTTIVAADVDAQTLTYAIAGGADAALFAIDPLTGVVSFIAAPDFEAPLDAGADNIYDVLVSASDGVLLDYQSLAISVGNVNEAPVITSNGGGATAAVTVSENTASVATVAATDPDGNPRSYSIVGGADATRFAIDAATGALSFVNAPNFEAPGDAGGNNIYDVVVQASDGTLFDTQAIAVTVANINEAPTITSNGGGATAAVTINENSLAVTTVASNDPDGNPRSYSIVGGADALRFTIDASTGALAFANAPNFEAPADAGANNVYDVIVQASDGSLIDTQAIAVTVANVNEAPLIAGGANAAIAVNENVTAVTTISSSDPEGTARTYSIVGGADAARFTINTTTGALSFVAAPNFEAPVDAGANNVYNLIVQASDGVNAVTQALAVTVNNVVDGSTINGTSSANTLNGTSAEDTINGLGGNDTITGGLGADRLTGGSGADRFTYTALADSQVGDRDVITDFLRSQSDRISLSAIDANANASGDQAFAFIGNAAFSNVAGQLRYSQLNGNTIVSGDVNGDGIADFAIELTGTMTLQSGDFIL